MPICDLTAYFVMFLQSESCHQGWKKKNSTDLAYLIVMNIFQRVADDTNPHVDQVRGGYFKDLLRKLLTILVDLLHTHTQRFVHVKLHNVKKKRKKGMPCASTEK